MVAAVVKAFTDIAGVVPCPGGWLVLPGRVAGVTVSAEAPFVVPNLRDVLDHRPAFAFAAYDIAFGFADSPAGPYRVCDEIARARLGWPRSAAVAPTPSRETLAADSFSDVQRLEPWLTASDYRRFPRLREAASEVQPFHARSSYAAIAELSFQRLNGGVGLQWSPWSEPGRAERLALIRAGLPGVDTVVVRSPPAGAHIKHVFAAAAMLWTARRASGRAIARLPVDPSWDGHGVRMEWVS